MTGAEILTWAVGIVGIPGTLIGGWAGVRQIRSATAADKALAVNQRAAELKAARQDERDRYLDRVAELTGERDAAVARADRAEARADGLQMLINKMRLGDQ